VWHGEGATVSGVVVGMKRASDCSAVVRWASREAVLRALPLSLVHVWDEPVEVVVDLDPDSEPDLVSVATSRAVPGAAAATLVAQEPDLLALGGHAGVPRLSAVARHCLRHAPCPVAIVPRDERPPTGRVVAGVGSGDGSRAALRWAADEAHRRDARLVVVHAWQVQVETASDLLRPAHTIPEQLDAAHDRLRAWVRDAVGDIDVDVHATHSGPLDALLRFSASADLTVIGHAVHPGWGRVLHGAVGSDLGGLAPCPVVFVPPPRD